jgi:hypothetical protein
MEQKRKIDKIVKKIMEEKSLLFDNDLPENVVEYKNKMKGVVDGDTEFDEGHLDEILFFKGDTKRFRASIYVDEQVPDTGDKEFDRKIAFKMMEYIASKLDTNSYVGGVGFKTSDIFNPYDKDF